MVWGDGWQSKRATVQLALEREELSKREKGESYNEEERGVATGKREELLQ